MKREHLSLVVFFAVVFGVPWSGWTVLQVYGIDWETPLGAALFSTGLACSLGGLLAVGVSEGWRGVRDRLVQAVRLKVSLAWWLYALLVPLLLVLASGGSYLLLTGSEPTPDWTVTRNWITLAALMIFIPGPLGEEFGWRGFLLPRLLQRMSFWWASMVVGAIWGVWHLPLYWGRVMQDGWLWFGLFCLGVLAFSVLISAVWIRTRSLLLAMIMHFAINLTQNWALFPQIGAEDRMPFLTVFVAASWVAAILTLVLVRPGRAADLTPANA